jgi:hypothetical protein
MSTGRATAVLSQKCDSFKRSKKKFILLKETVHPMEQIEEFISSLFYAFLERSAVSSL